jgi:hypothetical protein
MGLFEVMSNELLVTSFITHSCHPRLVTKLVPNIPVAAHSSHHNVIQRH